MKLISLKCPSCGSNLEVNGDLKQYTCNYCGTTTLLDDESKTVRNVYSKLDNCIIELEEYYNNGNYIKCGELAGKYYLDYPENQKIQFYYDSCYEAYVEDYIIQHLFVIGDWDYEEAIREVSFYHGLFPDNVEITNLYHQFNSKLNFKGLLSGIIIFCMIIIVIIIIIAIQL